MKETDFIDKHKQKWYDFEKMSNDKASDPDKLSELFVQMTEDLSYARTFYPKRSVRVYLNYLAQKVFNSYNKKRRADNTKKKAMTYEQRAIAILLFVTGGFLGFLATMWSSVATQLFVIVLAGSLFAMPLLFAKTRDFFLRSLPLEMYRSRKQLSSAFLFFAGAVLIGVISSYIDPEFSRVILGDSYVDMTLDNIANNDPMAVYKDSKETGMFLGITFNNIQVAFWAFVLGVFFSVGTIFLLVSNGIMLGAFQYFFYIKGLFLTSFLTIWIHGTLEISVIIIAGCAGLVVGNGLLFPKTLTRAQSFQMNAKRGIKILIGTVPVFVVAGFLEGFVTRHTEMHDLSKWAIIIGSFLFIMGYFVIYPYIVARREYPDLKIFNKYSPALMVLFGFFGYFLIYPFFDKTNTSNIFEEKPVYVPPQRLKKYRIRDLGDIFYDTFGFFRLKFGQFGRVIFQIILPLNLLFLILYYSFMEYGSYLLADDENIGFALAIGRDFNWIGFAANVFLFSLNIATVHHSLRLISQKNVKNYLAKWFKEIWLITLKTMPFVAGILLLLSYTPTEVLWLLIFIAPFFLLVFYPASVSNFGTGLSKGMNYSAKSWGIVFVSLLMMGGLSTLFYLALLSPVNFFLDDIVKWHTNTVFDNFIIIQNVVKAFFEILILHLVLPLLFASFGFQYFSMKEKEEAIELNTRLKRFGTTNKMYESK